MMNSDGCNVNCFKEFSSNGYTNNGEESDNGRTTTSDGCNATCFKEFCGDRFTNNDDGGTAWLTMQDNCCQLPAMHHDSKHFECFR